jgi:CheY-like chemotaxis protein
MESAGRRAVILYAEDDDDDYVLVRDALAEAGVAHDLRRVEDGEEVMDYLARRGRFAGAEAAPVPDIVLLDLNMPKKDGREVLRDLKVHPWLRRIPVIVLTTTRAEEDVARSYALGVNSFIRKPAAFQGLVEAMRAIGRYWFEVVELPGGTGRPDRRSTP